LLPRSGTGQKQTAYVSFLNGPRQAKTESGFEFHLVLMDNGRTRMLADEQMRESLYCIRCGACLNVCPVYQKIGGQAYGWIYPGPIGAVISPQLQSLKQSGDLPFASSLCGACRDACPVAINLPDMLLALRAKAKESDIGRNAGEQIAMRGVVFAARHPRFFAFGGKLMRGFTRLLGKNGAVKSARVAPLRDWTTYRDFPAPNGPSFRERWKQKEQK